MIIESDEIYPFYYPVEKIYGDSIDFWNDDYGKNVIKPAWWDDTIDFEFYKTAMVGYYKLQDQLSDFKDKLSKEAWIKKYS